MKNKKLILLVFVLIVLIIGGTYSAYNWTYTSTNPNTLSTNALEVKFLESNSEIINLTNALPMTDEEGKLEQSFDFAVTSKTISDVAIGYNLKIEKLELDTGYTAFQDNQMKICLTDYNDNVLLEPTKISELSNYKFYTGTQIHDSSHEMVQDKFKLRAWIDESVTEEARSWDMSTKLQYKFKIGVAANETNDLLTVNVVVNNGTITGDSSQSVVEGANPKFTITTTDSSYEGIVTCTNNQTGIIKNNTLTVNNITNDTTCTVTFTPSTTVLYTDGTLIINEKPSDREENITTHGAVTNEYPPLSNSNQYVFINNNTSQPWNAQKTSITRVEIGQEIQPTNTKYWFYGLRNMISGDFTNLDTSQVTDMLGMFCDTGVDSTNSFVLTGLDTWDTSKVTNMSNMFYNEEGSLATTWNIGDISEWDTSKVTNMSLMFAGAGAEATTFDLDLSNWDVSKVTDMYGMFGGIGSLSSTWSIGDLSNWDTSKVTNMDGMFYSAGHKATTWNIGDLSNWDTSKVTNMSNMFQAAGYSATTWSIGGLSTWDTSSVTNMSYMFLQAGKNATTWNIGDLSNWDTSKVTNMRDMFHSAGYSATTWSIGDLSSWDTSSVTNMSYMFDGAGENAATWNSIGTLDIYATNIAGMFDGASGAKATLNIYSSPTTYTDAFSDAATDSNALITVNYSNATTNIDDIIATKSSNSNVVKGSLLD